MELNDLLIMIKNYIKRESYQGFLHISHYGFCSVDAAFGVLLYGEATLTSLPKHICMHACTYVRGSVTYCSSFPIQTNIDINFMILIT